MPAAAPNPSFGGHEHTLRQTLVALTADTTFAEHENPGEATLYLVSGRARLRAVEDAAVLLTVAKHSQT